MVKKLNQSSGLHPIRPKVRKFEGSRVRRFFSPKVRKLEKKGSGVRTKRFCSPKVQNSEIMKYAIFLVINTRVRGCRGTLSVILGAHLIGSGSRPDVSMDCGSGLVDRPSAFVRRAIRWVTVDGSRSVSIVDLASLCMIKVRMLIHTYATLLKRRRMHRKTFSFDLISPC